MGFIPGGIRIGAGLQACRKALVIGAPSGAELVGDFIPDSGARRIQCRFFDPKFTDHREVMRQAFNYEMHSNARVVRNGKKTRAQSNNSHLFNEPASGDPRAIETA